MSQIPWSLDGLPLEWVTSHAEGDERKRMSGAELMREPEKE